MHYRTFLAAAALAILSVNSAEAAKKKVIDFGKFAGTYQSSYVISDGNNSYPGVVSVHVSTPQKGQKMVITITGVVNGGIPIAGSVTLTQKKALSNNVLLGFGGAPIIALPSKFNGKKKSFTFVVAAAPGAQLMGNSFTGAVTYTLSFGKKNVTISGSGVVTTGMNNTFPATLLITGARSGK